MGLTSKKRQIRDTPAAQAEVRELRQRASAALDRGMAAQAMADADAVMAAHVDAGPAGEPYLSARFWRARALGNLGQHAAAAGEIGRLIEDAVPLLGEKDTTVVMARMFHAGQLACIGRHEEAEAECRTAIRQSGKIWPQNARGPYRLAAMTQLVSVLNGRGLHAQAESTARSALREARGMLAVPDNGLVALRTGLASSLNSQHRHPEALQILQDLKPTDPKQSISIELQLAAAEICLGMPGDAETRAREAVTQAERLFGPAHYQTLAAGTRLGSAIAAQGRHDEAREQLQANAEAWLEHFGEDHPRTIAARKKLADPPASADHRCD